MLILVNRALRLLIKTNKLRVMQLSTLNHCKMERLGRHRLRLTLGIRTDFL